MIRPASILFYPLSSVFKRPIAACILLLVLCALHTARAQVFPYATQGVKEMDIIPFLLKDEMGEIGIRDFAAGNYSDKLIRAESPYLSFGDAPSPWWQTFQLQHDEERDKTFILWFRRRNADTIQIWHQKPDKVIDSLGMVGVAVHDRNRYFLANGYFVPITLKKGVNQIYIKSVNKIGTLYLNYTLYSPAQFKVQSKYTVIYFGIFAGVALVSLIFCVLMFLTFYERAYLFYALYVLAIVFRESYNHAAWLNLDCSMQRHGITLLFAASFGLFLRHFLKLWEFNAHFDRFIRYFCSALFLLIPVFAYLVDDEQHKIAKLLLQFILLSTLFGIVLIISYTIYRSRADLRAKIVLLAYTPLGFAGFLNIMRNLNLIPNYPLIQHSMMLGFILEISIFTFAFVRFYQSTKSQQVNLEFHLNLEERNRKKAVQDAENRVKEEIARDLHDDIAASVSGIRILSRLANDQISKKNQSLSPLFDQINKNAQHTLENISDLIWTLRPNTDPLVELSDRIRTYTVQLLENSDINYTIDIPKNLPALNLDPATRRNMLIIYKEGLNNALSHSKCQNIAIKLKIVQSKITLSISDDGIGFDAQIGQSGIGQGINNMYSRALEIDATLRINTNPKSGTEIILSKSLKESVSNNQISE